LFGVQQRTANQADYGPDRDAAFNQVCITHRVNGCRHSGSRHYQLTLMRTKKPCRYPIFGVFLPPCFPQHSSHSSFQYISRFRRNSA
jgi:hypothetical protein